MTNREHIGPAGTAELAEAKKRDLEIECETGKATGLPMSAPLGQVCVH